MPTNKLNYLAVAAAIVFVAIFAAALLGAGENPAVRTIEITAPPIYIPVYLQITAVPEPRIPDDLWICLTNPTLAQAAPEVSLDRNAFDVLDLDIESYGTESQYNHYRVFNYGKGKAGSVTVTWGLNGDGLMVITECAVPPGWGNVPMGVPSATPFLLPNESAGEPSS